MEIFQGNYVAAHRRADRKRGEDGKPDLDLSNILFDTSLSFSAEHHKQKPAHGPVAMRAGNAKPRRK